MMNYTDFGTQLIETNDLDPIYTMLAHSDLTSEEKKRWVLAYWFFYHAGVSSMIAFKTGAEYYKAMRAALTHPRGTERRYFRADVGGPVIDYLEMVGHPEEIVDWIASDGDFGNITRRVQAIPQCGPWIAFKVADMIDRCLGTPVDFSNCHLSIYKEPVKGAALIAYGDQNFPISRKIVISVYNDLVEEFKHFDAPPFYDRPVGLAEVETIACKYKSHVNGHYPVGKDIKDIYEHLVAYERFPIADRLKMAMGDAFNVSK
jgi:hypothetical protein